MDDVVLESKKKNGWIAALLNLIFFGAGYWYCERKLLGGFLMGVVVVFWTAAIAFPPLMSLSVFGGVFVLVGVIDGFLSANRYNQKLLQAVAANLTKCPKCAEMIQRDAKVCRFCHESTA